VNPWSDPNADPVADLLAWRELYIATPYTEVRLTMRRKILVGMVRTHGADFVRRIANQEAAKWGFDRARIYCYQET
jgi:hypothetical protein